MAQSARISLVAPNLTLFLEIRASRTLRYKRQCSVTVQRVRESPVNWASEVGLVDREEMSKARIFSWEQLSLARRPPSLYRGRARLACQEAERIEGSWAKNIPFLKLY